VAQTQAGPYDVRRVPLDAQGIVSNRQRRRLARPGTRRPRMAASESRLRIRDIGDGVTQVEFIDRNILDEANIQMIGEEIAQIIDTAGSPRLLISFSNVDHLSSAALGTLITINNKVRSKSGQLRLANIDPQIYEVFVITRLNKLFDIHETTDDAVQSFG
jgi:anti-sigma B factor antagonist